MNTVGVETPDEALSRLLADGSRRAARLGPDHVALWAALCDATEGGKRFRPALVLGAHDALGGRSPAAAAVVGAAVELLHTALLIHDDVIDGDETRRGRPNVSGTFAAMARAGGRSTSARHYGDTAGLLAGDLALTAAVRAVATCPAPTAVVHRLLDLFDDTLHATAAGELADVRLAALAPGSASLDDVLLMEQRKTSAYSFQLPLQAGAILAEAEPVMIDRLADAGRLLGIAFQLHDDLLGVFGDPAVTGKSAVNDLRLGKHTALVAHARTTPAWARLSVLVGDPGLDEAGAAEARTLLTDCGARGFAEGLAQEHLDLALDLLGSLGIPTTLVASLGRLGASATEAAA